MTYAVESVTGPPHDPLFVLSLQVRDFSRKFFGSGSSKKLARNSAALNALSCIFSFPNKIDDNNQTQLISDTLMLNNKNVLASAEVMNETDKIIESKGKSKGPYVSLVLYLSRSVEYLRDCGKY